MSWTRRSTEKRPRTCSRAAAPIARAPRRRPRARRSPAPALVVAGRGQQPGVGVTTSATPPTVVGHGGRAGRAASISETGVPSLSELSTAMSEAAATGTMSAR